MRFSFWPNPSQPFNEVHKLGLHIESNGWDGIWFADHFMPNGGDIQGSFPESWTTMTALAARVPRIRVGTLVTGNTYRHPTLLANMAANLDQISEGRLVLGLGAGWQINEHEVYGLDLGTVQTRLRRLEEACQIIKGLFREETYSFDGEFYQLKDAPLKPKPCQENLPLLIGGGGEKVTLRITAQYADEWNVWGDVEILRHKMTILDQHCDKLGRDPSEIQRSAVALLFLSEDEAFIKRMRETPTPMPSIVGNVSQLRDIIHEFDDAGVNELIVPDFTLPAGQEKLDILNTFINEVATAAQ